MMFNPSAIDASAVRDLLKTKRHFLAYGIPPTALEVAMIDHITEEYKQRIGRRTYVSQMLDPLAKMPVGDCLMYDVNDKLIEPHPSDIRLSIQRWIVRHKAAVWRVCALGQERYL